MHRIMFPVRSSMTSRIPQLYLQPSLVIQ